MDLIDDLAKGQEMVEHHDSVSSTDIIPLPPSDKKLLRRIDLFVLPPICILYAFSLIDRTNIANANIAGLAVDLSLKGSDYSVALLSFFITYVIAEIPSNLIIRHVGTRYYLTTLILCFGVVAMSQGFVQTFPQLVVLRVLLGAFEGGFNVRRFLVPPYSIFLTQIACLYLFDLVMVS